MGEANTQKPHEDTHIKANTSKMKEEKWKIEFVDLIGTWNIPRVLEFKKKQQHENTFVLLPQSSL